MGTDNRSTLLSTVLCDIRMLSAVSSHIIEDPARLARQVIRGPKLHHDLPAVSKICAHAWGEGVGTRCAVQPSVAGSVGKGHQHLSFWRALYLPLTLSQGSVNKPTVCNSFTELFQLLGDKFVVGMPWKICGLPRASTTPRATAFSSRAVGPSVRSRL